jgi:hypothetical protein
MQGEVLQPIAFLRNHDTIWQWLKRSGMPFLMRWSLMRRIRLWRSPGERMVRRQLLDAAPAGPAGEILKQLEDTGIARIGKAFAPHAEAIALRLSSIFAESAKSSNNQRTSSNKAGFLVTLLRDADFIAHPEVLSFMSDRRFVDLAGHYLGEVPLLSSAQLWWPINTTAKSSQLYHFDEEDDRQLKFFLNVEAVGPEHGPFTAIPAKASARAKARTGSMHGRFHDDLVDACLNGKPPTAFTGARGTLAAVDTSRCLHYGSRGNSADRAVLMFQFTRFSAPLGRIPNWGEEIKPFARNLSAAQRRALQLT